MDLDLPISSSPKAFVCPLTHEVMKDPVVDPEGTSYEREAIEEWLGRNATSPMTRNPLQVKDLVPNRALRELIEEASVATNMSMSADTSASTQAYIPIAAVSDNNNATTPIAAASDNNNATTTLPTPTSAATVANSNAGVDITVKDLSVMGGDTIYGTIKPGADGPLAFLAATPGINRIMYGAYNIRAFKDATLDDEDVRKIPNDDASQYKIALDLASIMMKSAWVGNEEYVADLFHTVNSEEPAIHVDRDVMSGKTWVVFTGNSSTNFILKHLEGCNTVCTIALGPEVPQAVVDGVNRVAREKEWLKLKPEIGWTSEDLLPLPERFCIIR